MLKASIKLTNLELNEGQYTQKLFDVLDTQNRQAAREWLKAVILRVPVFTGEARGSLKPLGAFLRVAIPISPVAVRKNHSPETGATQSTFEFTKGYVTEFIFTQNLVHYIINEYYDANPPIHLTHFPRPWFSFQVGRAAYRAFMKKYLKDKLPKIKDYTLRGIIQDTSVPGKIPGKNPGKLR